MIANITERTKDDKTLQREQRRQNTTHRTENNITPHREQKTAKHHKET
jgi:hypothetical protein